MRTFKISIVLFSLVVASCKNDHKDLYENLRGDWKCINTSKESSPFRRPNLIEGFTFLDDGICYSKLGYFKVITTKIPRLEKAIGNNTEQTTTYFLGTETKYKIEKDSLKVFNLADSVWDGKKIIKLFNDTLILQFSNQAVATFTKSKQKIDTVLLFDELVVSSSGCYGTCPINNVLIRRSGQAVYHGENYNKKDGLYTFIVTKDQFNQIESDFKLARIDTLKNSYAANWTDDETITVTFLKEGKIVKNIRDYGKVGPVELYWAYMPVSEMYQLKQLDSLKEVQSPVKQSEAIMFSFQLTLGLSQSDAFYLWNLLRQAKEINQDFTKRYEINFHGIDSIEKVETDGRYYKFEMSKGNKKVFDIGYNFFEVNEFSRRLKNNVNLKVYK